MVVSTDCDDGLQRERLGIFFLEDEKACNLHVLSSLRARGRWQKPDAPQACITELFFIVSWNSLKENWPTLLCDEVDTPQISASLLIFRWRSSKKSNVRSSGHGGTARCKICHRDIVDASITAIKRLYQERPTTITNTKHITAVPLDVNNLFALKHCVVYLVTVSFFSILESIEVNLSARKHHAKKTCALLVTADPNWRLIALNGGPRLDLQLLATFELALHELATQKN